MCVYPSIGMGGSHRKPIAQLAREAVMADPPLTQKKDKDHGFNPSDIA
jgi:hypothetical protein